MNAMQYKIKLPENFDMDVIRKRVNDNGFKTDGFEGLLFKAYLIKDTESEKEYSPLYIWKDSEGMNKFIFDGFYDNILNSFGWQHINIGIPLEISLNDNFSKAKYLLELENHIEPTKKLSRPKFSGFKNENSGKVLIYNPDKWKYAEFYFCEEKPDVNNGNVYDILHISV